MSLLCASLLLQVGGAWEEMHVLTSGAAYEDIYGWSLVNAGDLDGDGADDLIVSSLWHGQGSIGYGAVFVHSGASGALLRRHDSSAQRISYGFDVAGGADLDGDLVPDYVVGNGSESPANQAVDVFSGATGALLFQLVPPVAARWFGIVVAIVGDLDQDGVADLAIVSAAPGLAHIHHYSGSTGVFLGSLALPYSATDVVALDDLDGDLVADLAVASPYDANSKGRVFVLSGATGAELRRWEGGASHDLLGWSMAAVPDRDGDGKRDLLIGVPTYLDQGHVLLASTGSGATLERWDRIGGVGPENLGECVGVAGDMEGDGVEDYLMGGGYMTIAGAPVGGGGIQIVSGATSELMHERYGSYGSYLGHACVSLGDLDQDGLAEAAVSATTFPLEGGWVSGPGMVQIFGFERFLNPTATELSAAAGSSVTLDFDFPASAAGWVYRFLISATGDGPTLAGVLIPLTPDALVARTWAGGYPPAMNGLSLSGILDGAGHATGSFAFAPGLLGSLVGRTIYTAAVALPLGASRPQISSASVRFTVTP